MKAVTIDPEVIGFIASDAINVYLREAEKTELTQDELAMYKNQDVHFQLVSKAIVVCVKNWSAYTVKEPDPRPIVADPEDSV